jgi:hypothetical protein
VDANVLRSCVPIDELRVAGEKFLFLEVFLLFLVIVLLRDNFGDFGYFVYFWVFWAISGVIFQFSFVQSR